MTVLGGRQRELRLQRGAGRAPQDRPPVPRDQVARGRGPRADGDRGGLRRRRLEADGRAARPAGPHHPRGVRRLGLRLRRADRRARGDGPARCCAPRTSRPWCSPPTRCCTPATTPPRRSCLPGIASGETIATLAFTEENGRWDEAGITLTATKRRRRLDARRHQDVRARRPHRRPDPRGRPHRRRREPLRRRRRRRRASPARRCPPWTRPASRPSSSSPARRPRSSAPTASGWDVLLERVLDLAAVALAAEQVGGAQTCLDMAVQYAKDRVQFGRPIGSFQAIKHKCADMLLEVESAKSAAYYAGWCAAGAERRAARRWPAWPRPTARRRTSTPPPRTSRSTAASASPGSTPPTCTSSGPSRSELLFGDPTYHRELLAQRIGI